ncbi:DUF1772 domain-containing protein [Vibrio sp. VB16]|uniref:DUF1772 domain-containing protein n=1 Tax=Vibrio sp. VB16 TaxID=2785746 RepID=UPI00189EDEE2|nr:DUF1772 domain-containing protein [Vibrio sp. VB16]UGA53541.1 DUF1772 domain-containing protein [Vibrio sp. VB16]
MATGLLAGGLLTEARILVPYWRQMPTEDFLKLHHTMAPSLYRYFAPLTVMGTISPILACIFVSAPNRVVESAWLISAVSALLLLGFYLFFFRSANNTFSKTTDVEVAKPILEKWASMHTIRTWIACVSFLSAILASIMA